MKYVLLIAVTAIVARAARERLRAFRGHRPVKTPPPARSSVSLALIVTIFVVLWPLNLAVHLAGADPPHVRSALVWVGFALVAPLAAAYSYRRAKAADVPAFVVTQSTLTSYTFAGLAVAAAGAAVWLSNLAL